MSIFNTVPPLAAGRGLTFDGETMSLQVPQGAGAHNAIYRGKALGSAVTDAQWAAIAAGTFDDLYIGDYWTIGGVNWRIAAFDYYFNTGETLCKTHHVTVAPDDCLYNAKFNDAGSTDGAYANSKLYKSGLDSAKATIKNAFGADHILSHMTMLPNGTSGNVTVGASWYTSQVELMSEWHVYGASIYGNYSSGSGYVNLYSVDNFQLPLFALAPSNARISEVWWLRDVVSSDSIAVVGNDGLCNAANPANEYGVRPVFSLAA